VLDLDMQDPEHSPLPGRQEAEQDPADDQGRPARLLASDRRAPPRARL
jgi:hypothetical protein